MALPRARGIIRRGATPPGGLATAQRGRRFHVQLSLHRVTDVTPLSSYRLLRHASEPSTNVLDSLFRGAGVSMSNQTQTFALSDNPSSEVNRFLTALSIVALSLAGGASTEGAPLLRCNSQKAAGTSAAKAARDIGPLAPGKSVTRELAGGEADSYQITLSAGQYLRVDVDHARTSMVVSLVGPDNRTLTETVGTATDPIEWVCEAAGTYLLVVRSRNESAAAAAYQAKIADLRAASPEDGTRVAGQRACHEGEQLEAQGTAQSRRAAIARFEEALPLSQAASDRSGQARALRGIGVSYNSLGDYKKAIDYYNRALPLFQQEQNRQGEAITLNNIGGSLLESNDYRKSLEYFDKALALFRALGDRDREAVALGNLGRVYRGLNDRQKALDYNNQALAIWQALGDHRDEALTLNNIAVLYNSMGESQKALEFYEKALPMRRDAGDKEGEAVTLNNIGRVYDVLGQKRKALDYLNQSLVLRRELRDQRGEAVTLNNIGGVYRDLGEYQKALDSYDQSLPLRRAVGDKSGEAATLNGLGSLYASLGENQRALDHYEQALAILRDTNDITGRAIVLNNIGKIFRTMGDYQKALDYYNQSLPLREAARDRRGQATTLSNIGMAYNWLGDRQKALEYYDKSLAMTRQARDRAGEGIILDNIGSVYVALGDPDKAFDYFNQALTLRREVQDRQGEAITLTNLARVERDRGNLLAARDDTEAALRLLESLRTSIVGQELRSSYFASVQGAFGFYIDLLMRLDKQHPSEGHVAAALQASEEARARSLLELLTEALAGIRQGADAGLLERERDLRMQLSVKAEAQMRLLSANPVPKQAAAIRKEIEALAIQYNEVETQMRIQSPKYAALTQPQPAGLNEIQQQLDSDTLLLEYALGEDRSFLWAVSTTSVAAYELPKRADIEVAAKRVYSLFTARQPVAGETADQERVRIAKADAAYPSAARALSNMLLAPVALHLRTRRLVVVADGALRYVAFGALPVPVTGRQGVAGSNPFNARKGKMDDGTPLIVDHEIVSLPSASTIALLRRATSGRKPALKTVAVIADPVFDKDDDRVAMATAQPGHQEPVAGDRDLRRAVREVGVTGTGLRIPRLPFSREEAEAIIAVAPAGSGMSATGFKANRATATSSELSHYRIVHFATHALLNGEHPELSGIVLSLVDEQGHAQDGFLRLQDLFNLNLSAELVVLSACQTGLGKEIRGEGLIGLTRGFMYAGAPRVVASLWKVSDRATAELMGHFDGGLLKQRMTPAAALRAAQVAMLKNKRWHAPYYWAPFVLQGEWR